MIPFSCKTPMPRFKACEVRQTPRTARDDEDIVSLTPHKAVSRSDFSSRQALSPSSAAARSEDRASSPSTPHINGFAETYDRLRGSDERTTPTPLATRREESTADHEDGDGGGEGGKEDDDDFRSAISEAGTTTPRSRRSTVGGRTLNSPLPGRRTPRKLARRSIGASERGGPSDGTISEQEVGEETKVPSTV